VPSYREAEGWGTAQWTYPCTCHDAALVALRVECGGSFCTPDGIAQLYRLNRDGVAHFVSHHLAVADLFDLPIVPVEPHLGKRLEVFERPAM
jgi:hypothetical protein